MNAENAEGDAQLSQSDEETPTDQLNMPTEALMHSQKSKKAKVIQKNLVGDYQYDKLLLFTESQLVSNNIGGITDYEEKFIKLVDIMKTTV